MALPIRDGNQSPTTLSTIIVNNAHIPAHTVISFGTQGITDIATAVSGVELGPNTLNALENITVTLGQVTITGGLTDGQLRASAVTIGGSVTATISGTASVTFGTAVVTGSVSILNFPATQTVTFTQSSVTFGEVVVTGSTSIIGTPSVTFTQASVTFGQSSITGSVSVLNLPATQTVTFTQASVTFGEVVVTGSTSILNFPATQTIAGTVTANGGDFTGTDSDPTRAVQLGFKEANGSGDFVFVNNDTRPFPVQVLSSTVTANVGNAQFDGNGNLLVCLQSGSSPSTQSISGTVTIGSALPAGTNSIGTVTANVPYISNLPASQTQAIPVVLITDEGKSVFEVNQSIKATINGSIPAGTNSIGVVTIGAGTVTIGAGTAQIGSVTASISGTVPISISSVTVGNSVTIGSALPTGTNRIGVVTIGNIQRDGDGVQSSLLTEVGSGYLLNRSYLGAGLQQIGSVTAAISGTVPISISSVTVGNSVTVGSLPAISGTVTANVFGKDANNQSVDAQIPVIAYDEEITGASVSYVVPVQISNNHGTIGSSNPLPISGTVTANSSNGSLTTRFGSVTIANTAFATSAVTNSNRKYLLIQNITTASNVITVGVGFTPTTTQGIQLTAGAGLTFEGNYIPTGAVNLLSSVTASCFTILEA